MPKKGVLKPTRQVKKPLVVNNLIKTGRANEKVNFYEAHESCYLKEARAMLEGKDTKGKNRCVKLPGDE